METKALEQNVQIKDKLNLTITEAAEYSNIGQNTIRELLKRKGCPFIIMIGRRQLIKRKQFEEYLDNIHFL